MVYYDELKGYHELHKEEQLRKMELISSNLNVKKSDYLLDVGCGSGLSLDFFDCKKIGIDPSEELLKNCKGKTVCGFGEDLPFDDETFDIVTCVSAIHNFDDPEKGIKEIKRVAKDKIVITVFKKGEGEKVKKIIKLVEKNLKVYLTVNDQHDHILFCRK